MRATQKLGFNEVMPVIIDRLKPMAENIGISNGCMFTLYKLSYSEGFWGLSRFFYRQNQSVSNAFYVYMPIYLKPEWLRFMPILFSIRIRQVQI